jgi:hypothetical protein
MSTLVTNAIKHGASGSNNVELDSSGNLKFNSGYGSPEVAYGCRAWVNFNGTSTVAIRASGNVSSITDNGVGDYTVNFTTAMPDVNYSPCGTTGATVANNVFVAGANAAPTTTAYRLNTRTTSNTNGDMEYVNVAIFR